MRAILLDALSNTMEIFVQEVSLCGQSCQTAAEGVQEVLNVR